MTVTLAELSADLEAETRVVDGMVADLVPQRWDTPTPAEGWSVRDQISHLAYFDDAVILAATDPEKFRARTAELLTIGPSFPDKIAEEYRGMAVPELLDWFRAARRRVLDTFSTMDAKARIPWYGPDMSATSSITARLMETWAHGTDVADALGAHREPTARLRHVAHIGVRTFGFSFQLNGREAPRTPVYVELIAPDGALWTWGDEHATDRVSGPALDFCLAVTQRRHLTDTALAVHGPTATEWMSVAQAYAGAPGPGRRPSRENG